MPSGDIMAREDKPIPDWLHDYIMQLRERLLLQVWELRVEIVRVVDGDEHVQGMADVQHRYNVATLTFSSDIEDTPYWRNIVKHEMLEVVLGYMTMYVKDRLAPAFTGGESDRVCDVYDDYKDRVIQTLVRAITD